VTPRSAAPAVVGPGAACIFSCGGRPAERPCCPCRPAVLDWDACQTRTRPWLDVGA